MLLEKLARFLRMKFAGCAYHRVLRNGVERERGPLAVGAFGGAGERVLRRVSADDVTIVAVADVRLREHGDGPLAGGEAVGPFLPFIYTLWGAGRAIPLLLGFGRCDSQEREEPRSQHFVGLVYRCPNRSPAAARERTKIEMGSGARACDPSVVRRSAED